MIHAIALMVWCAWPQAPQPAAPETPAPKLVELARAARTKGNTQDALRLAGEAMARQPSLRDAADLTIDLTASAGDLAAAFHAYDRFVNAGGVADRALLVPIARAELRKLRENELAEIRASALATLSVAGDKDARKDLERASVGAQASAAVAADSALAKLGDERAATRFAERIRQGSIGARLSALDAVKDLTSASPTLEGAVVAAIEDKENAVRASAAQAAGQMKLRSALPALRRTLAEQAPYLVRLSAAVSLRKLGDPAGDELLRQALASDIAEARTFAARAFTAAESGLWRNAIEALLPTATGLDALGAAELLLPLKSEAAGKIVERAASDPNPSIRARAARIAARQPAIAPALVRRLLADDAPLVRLYTAEGMMPPAQSASVRR